MPRNFHRRVEVMVPILDPDIKNRAHERDLGHFERRQRQELEARAPTAATPASSRPPGEAPVRAQSRFIELARERVKEGEAHIRSSGRYQFVQVHPVAKNGIPEERRRRQQNVQRSSNAKRRT